MAPTSLVLEDFMTGSGHSPTLFDAVTTLSHSDAVDTFLDTSWGFPDLDLGNGTMDLNALQYPQLQEQSAAAESSWDDSMVDEIGSSGQPESNPGTLLGRVHKTKLLKRHRTGITRPPKKANNDEQAQSIQHTRVEQALSTFWPRVRETATWSFCASELLSYVSLFSKTASTPFIPASSLQKGARYTRLLMRALSVCAAHETLAGRDDGVFGQLLDVEVDNLVESAESATTLSLSNISRFSKLSGVIESVDHIDAFRRELARVQALTLYHIMRLFGNDVSQRRQAEQQEPLLAAWTTSLQLRMQMIENEMMERPVSPASNSPTASPLEPQETDEEHDNDLHARSNSSYTIDQLDKESAHRTILISHFVRAVYAVIAYGICPLIMELNSLPVSAPPCPDRGPYNSTREKSHLQSPNNEAVSYSDFVTMWERGTVLDEDGNGQYWKLLLVACKGIGVLANFA